jgi:hypothetical protein
MARPSAEDEYWYDAAQKLTPDKSLERTQTLANFVFTNVAVVGTLLGGLGLVADKAGGIRDAPEVFGVSLPVLLVGASLLAASVAVWPKLSALKHNQVGEIKSWYEGQILRRGIAVIVALTLFSAAIVVATLYYSDPAVGDVAVSAAVTHGEKPKLDVTVEATGVSSSAVTSTRVVQGASSALFDSTGRANASGALKVSASVEGKAGGGRFHVTAVVKDGSEVIAEKSLFVDP